MDKIRLISYDCGYGAKDIGCGDGAGALRKAKLENSLHEYQINASWSKAGVKAKLKDAANLVIEHCNILYSQVTNALEQKYFPVTLGGDHSMAVGTFNAVADYYNIRGELGLIWVDAHMDSHTVETSPSKAYHGMPLAALLGYGDREFCYLHNAKAKTSVLDKDRVCIIGVRSYEKEEKQLLEALNIRIFYMEEVAAKGLKNVLNEAVAIATKGNGLFGLSIDLDAFDPKDVPGIGTPAKTGIKAKEAITAFSYFLQNNKNKIKALEIAEFNPHHDRNNITCDFIKNILVSICKLSK